MSFSGFSANFSLLAVRLLKKCVSAEFMIYSAEKTNNKIFIIQRAKVTICDPKFNAKEFVRTEQPTQLPNKSTTNDNNVKKAHCVDAMRKSSTIAD